MSLDSYTINISAALLSGIMSVTMFAMYRANQNEYCFLDWAGAGFCNLMAYILVAFGMSSNDASLEPFYTGVSNTLFLLAHCAILRGLLRHLNRKLYTLEMALCAIVIALAHQLPTINASFENRLILFLLLTALVKSCSILLLAGAIKKTKQWSYFPLLIIEFFFVLQMLLRTAATFKSEVPILIIEDNNAIQSIGWLSDLLYISVATLACVLIVVRKQVLEIRILSLTDQLTGCYNRHAMQEHSSYSFAESKRLNNQLGVIIIDIDFFKKINDNYGHDVGDSAIKHTVTAIREVLRETDRLYRLGGEEFVVITTGSNSAGLAKLADKMRINVESKQFNSGSEQLTITVSIGVSTTNQADGHWEEALKRADQALYQAKSNGRNQVVKNDSAMPAF